MHILKCFLSLVDKTYFMTQDSLDKKISPYAKYMIRLKGYNVFDKETGKKTDKAIAFFSMTSGIHELISLNKIIDDFEKGKNEKYSFSKKTKEDEIKSIWLNNYKEKQDENKK